MVLRVLACVLSMFAAGVPALVMSADRAIDPIAARRRMALPATKIMVLGLSHLDGAPASFNTAWLEPVLCRLRAYRPTVVLTEAMSGEEITNLDAYSAYHGAEPGTYAGPTLKQARVAQAWLEMSAAQALTAANALAAKHPATPAERRRLAALFVAAAEPSSAQVQWFRLAPAERMAKDGVDPTTARSLDQSLPRRSELVSIAARTAADVGLERVYSAGSHASDVVQPLWVDFQKVFEATPGQKALANHLDERWSSLPDDRLTMKSADEVMPAFKAKNSSVFARMDADGQWLSILRSPTMGTAGRQWVAAWEAQNLRMALRIREATAGDPGGRALLIVGAAHKPFIEMYLRQLIDLEIVDVAAILNAEPAGCAT
ncbi:MAG TPA: DUF5694 domain-containing protein [Sphingomicrobium sp.]